MIIEVTWVQRCRIFFSIIWICGFRVMYIQWSKIAVLCKSYSTRETETRDIGLKRHIDPWPLIFPRIFWGIHEGVFLRNRVHLVFSGIDVSLLWNMSASATDSICDPNNVPGANTIDIIWSRYSPQTSSFTVLHIKMYLHCMSLSIQYTQSNHLINKCH